MNIKSYPGNNVFKTSNRLKTKKIVEYPNNKNPNDGDKNIVETIPGFDLFDNLRKLVDGDQWKNGGEKADKKPEQKMIFVSGYLKNKSNHLTSARLHGINID